MRHFLALGTIVLLFTAAGLAQKPVVVGICPFYDETGTAAGEQVSTMLPLYFLQKAKSTGYVPVIVNLGPEWATGDNDWPQEVARAIGVDVVLVGRVRALATSHGKKPGDEVLRGHVLLSSHAATLVLEATLIEVATGKELGVIEAAETIKGSWLEEAAARYTGVGALFHHDPFWFADTHFGQAIGRSAEKLAGEIAPRLSQVQPGGGYSVVPAGASCKVKIRVAYKAKNRASKMYLIAVNGKEESLGIDDGIVELQEPSGPILLHVTVKDPPFRQPVQNTYYANSMLDCAQPGNTLVFEIGGGGEAVIRRSSPAAAGR